MMILSGYTLGFFFPKQVKSTAAPPASLPPDKIVAGPRDLNRTRPDAECESREVPAGFNFCRGL